MTSYASKFNALIKRLAPSGAGFITGAVTALVLYLANHVFKLHLLSSDVETALTPVIAFALASIAHNGTKVQAVADDAINKVQAAIDKLESNDPLVKVLLTTLTTQLAAHPELKGELTKFLLAELAKIEAASPVVKAVATDVPEAIAAIKAAEPGPPAPTTNPPETVQPVSVVTVPVQTTAAAITLPPPEPAAPVVVPAEPAVVATDPPAPEGAPGFAIKPTP